MSLYVDIKKDFGGFVLETKFEEDSGVLGILGASGCGKSMTLRCIAGIVKPDQGRIELDGTVLFDSEKKINLRPQERRVGLLFQNYALFPNMTVRQNLMTGLIAYEKEKKRANAAIDAIEARFCLTELDQHRPSQLSGGQQQRVALARILLSRPGLLMLDEPFSALDEYLRWSMELELKEVLSGFAGSTLFVSHSRDEIYRVCDRACVMDHGKASPAVSVKELFEMPRTKAAALLSGCKNYSGAHQESNGDITAEDWGITFKGLKKRTEQVNYVGVRSHALRPVLESEDHSGSTSYDLECEILSIVEDVFSMVVMVRPLNAPGKKQKPGEQNDRLRMEISKEQWKAVALKAEKEKKIRIRIQAKDIMVLE